MLGYAGRSHHIRTHANKTTIHWNTTDYTPFAEDYDVCRYRIYPCWAIYGRGFVFLSSPICSQLYKWIQYLHQHNPPQLGDTSPHLSRIRDVYNTSNQLRTEEGKPT